MAHRLFVVHASHPCAAVERAFELKGIPYRVVELPPAIHAGVQRAVFGARTVPGLRVEGGERISGSRAIMRWLDAQRPEPPLLPADPARRAAVEAAETWGDEIYQPIARRLLWSAFGAAPAAMASYQRGGRLPALPEPVLLRLAPAVLAVERRLNAVTPEAVAADLEALPGHLDRIDAWIAEGVLGGDEVNAADLQVATTSRLLMTLDDLETTFAGRPAREHALALFPEGAGRVPAGALLT
jgi:glutathione S-transferase